MPHPRRSRLAFAIITTAAAAAALGSGAASPAASAPAFTFTNFEPAGLSAFGLDEGGGTVGTQCPGAGADKCWNTAAEPAIRADAAGNFYAASENGLGAGTEAWKSTDGGRHYVTLPSPNAVAEGNDSGVAPGGGDVDVATGSELNAAGLYPVHVSSLNLANVDVSNSQDGGASWTLQPAAAKLVGDDREWIAADDSHQNALQLPVEGGDKVCISYHDTVQNISVDCDYNGGLAFPQHSSAIDAAHAFLIANNQIGNLAIARQTLAGDRTKGNHNLYQVFSGPQNAAGTVGCGGFTCYNVVYIAVSKDGGLTFTDHVVHLNPDINASYGHQFVNVSVDRRGNVYVVYCDDHNVYYSFSKDQGSTWSRAIRVNSAPANTAIFPWSVAGNSGAIDIVYYGTSHSPSAGERPDNYPASAAWRVYFAQNLHALSATSKFTQVAASPINHFGGVCESGIGCTGNRDLYDDFGVAASPTTGLASIVYSDDQYRANDPNNPNPPACTPDRTNTGSCDHTAVATQLSGPGIY